MNGLDVDGRYVGGREGKETKRNERKPKKGTDRKEKERDGKENRKYEQNGAEKLSKFRKKTTNINENQEN